MKTKIEEFDAIPQILICLEPVGKRDAKLLKIIKEVRPYAFLCKYTIDGRVCLQFPRKVVKKFYLPKGGERWTAKRK